MRLTSIFENTELLTGGSDDIACVSGYKSYAGKKVKLNVLALGDVGSTLAMALMLRGADAIEKIGLCDINPASAARFEFEFGQFSMPTDYHAFPEVCAVAPEDVFDCDVFVFCAALGVPKVGAEQGDVRMMQLQRNVKLVQSYAERSLKDGFEGEFFVVSDPVDPLCKGALDAGVPRNRIQGFGLGVMNARAAYFAKKDPSLTQYLTEGRAYGPHGSGLVIADSITNYNHEKSLELSKLTITANLKMREMGFKPYIAPAVSSGALSIIENLRGNWHYSSACFGGAFWGMKNRRAAGGLEIENPDLDEKLMDRIRASYEELKNI